MSEKIKYILTEFFCFDNIDNNQIEFLVEIINKLRLENLFVAMFICEFYQFSKSQFAEKIYRYLEECSLKELDKKIDESQLKIFDSKLFNVALIN